MAATEPAGIRPSTDDVCREAAEKLSSIYIKDGAEVDSNTMLFKGVKNDRPPPYSEFPLTFQREVYSPQSFLVPPPPPPSPGDSLKVTPVQQPQQGQGEYVIHPIPCAPPLPPVPGPPKQDNLKPPGSVAAAYHANTSISSNYLPVVPAISHGGSLNPSPMHNQVDPSTKTCIATGGQLEMPSYPQVQYAQPIPALATSTPVTVQPPPPPPPPLPPPPPPPPCPATIQYDSPTINNQNVNTNTNQNVNNVNVNVETGYKKRYYPNYMCFSVILCLVCWICNPIVYICIVPALICSCYSCTANTYRKSRFGGKWAFSCDLTALVCGLVSFVLLVLPFVIIFSMAGSGMFALGSLFKEHIKNLTETITTDHSSAVTATR